MQIKIETMIASGIVAVIASLPIAVPAQAGNMLFGSDFTTGENIPSVLRGDGRSVTTVGIHSVVATERNATRQRARDDAVYGSAGEPRSSSNHTDSPSFANLISYGISGARVFGSEADAIAAPSDANTAAFLAAAGSALADFSSPGAVADAISSMPTDHADIGGGTPFGDNEGGIYLSAVQMLGLGTTGIVSYGNTGSSTTVQEPENLSRLSEALDDRPLVLKWIHSMLEAVGVKSQCDDPSESYSSKCDERVAAK